MIRSGGIGGGARKFISGVLLVLALWDIALWAITFFLPEFWYRSVHGTRAMDAQRLADWTFAAFAPTLVTSSRLTLIINPFLNIALCVYLMHVYRTLSCDPATA